MKQHFSYSMFLQRKQLFNVHKLAFFHRGQGVQPKAVCPLRDSLQQKILVQNNRKITIAIEILHNNRFCTPEKIPERKPDKHVLHTEIWNLNV